MYGWRTLLLWAGLLATVAAADRTSAEPSEAERRALLALPEFDIIGPNAAMRWQEALASMPPLNPLESAVLETLPDEQPNEEVLAQFREMVRRRTAALAAFTVRAGESARLPPGFALGRGFAPPDEWRTLAQLKALQARLLWWTGDRAQSAAAASALVRAGGAATRDATDLNSWVTWESIASDACDTALWIARQFDAGEEELVALSAALGDARGGWPTGAANALRGEIAFGFRGALEHLGDTHDIAEMLGKLADFGTPTLPPGANAELGEADKPLLDREATIDLYGQIAAQFIGTAMESPVWRHGVFAADVERRSDALLAELGVFGELAMDRQLAEYPADQLAAIRAALVRAENPVGKLLVVLGAPNLDALAFTGIRTEAQRRCVRVLVEWRRRVSAGEELPATAEAWAAAGLPAEEIEDPFSGNPLFFDSENLRVWSVGLDGTNNRGTGDPREEVDGVDFWWSLETE